MKALITGSEGFVGRYLRAELLSAGYEVTGIDLAAGEGTLAADLLDPGAAESAVSQAAPDVVFHLAGQADVGRSWQIPQKTIQINEIAAWFLKTCVEEFNWMSIQDIVNGWIAKADRRLPPRRFAPKTFTLYNRCVQNQGMAILQEFFRWIVRLNIQKHRLTVSFSYQLNAISRRTPSLFRRSA